MQQHSYVRNYDGVTLCNMFRVEGSHTEAREENEGNYSRVNSCRRQGTLHASNVITRTTLADTSHLKKHTLHCHLHLRWHNNRKIIRNI